MMESVQIKLFLGIAAVVTVLVSMTTGCKISQGWQDLTMEERLVLSDIVVYGKTKQHVASTVTVNGQSKFFIDAVFEVYCVLKADENDIPDEITIAMVAPRDRCSGSRLHLGIDNEGIIGLKKDVDGPKFLFDEVMPTLSATFNPSRTNFFTISQICGLQQWQMPTGAQENRCPICGINNFTQASIEADASEVLSPCVVNGIDFSNGTDCDLFQTTRPDNTTVCLPSTYTQTCQQITVFESQVTCDCSVDLSSNRNGNFIDVSTANHFIGSFVGIMFSALVSILYNL